MRIEPAAPHLSAYREGADPLDWSIGLVRDLVKIHLSVAATRAHNEAAFPGYALRLTHEALVCRIVGEMLDAGWAPPSATDPET